MFFFVRKLHRLVNVIWKCITALFTPSKGVKSEVTPFNGEECWKSDEWEEFSISVIPNTSTDQPDPLGSNVPDVFSDMQPVIKKAKKIVVQSSVEIANSNQIDFTVQDHPHQDVCISGELGTWSEGKEGDGEGWEDELVMDESHVVQESRFAIKEKRRKERQFRRQAQDVMRAQQKTSSHPYLGVKADSIST